MFTLYIDDSGTDPKQHVAIATALIIPAIQIVRLEREWNRFQEKENFECFHTAPFIARNSHSEFANWDDEKQGRVFRRVRQLCRKYGTRALSIAVNKKDYDEVVPQDFRNFLGKTHYGWAVRQVIAGLQDMCPAKPNSHREFVFQWIERREPARKEIEEIMDQMQFVAEREGAPADYSDPHFRKSTGIPGLQCVDAVSWVCYQYALYIFRQIPPKNFAMESWRDFGGDLGKAGWLKALTIERKNLEKAIQNAIPDGKAEQFFKEWKEFQRAADEKRIGIQKVRRHNA